MLFSREYDYAIRIIRALSPGELLSVDMIVRKENVPKAYAYKIADKLKKANIISGCKGAHGGYQLFKPLAEISLYDIYTAIEDELIINECLKKGVKCPNNTEGDRCKVHQVLGGLQDQLQDMLKNSKMETVVAGATG